MMFGSGSISQTKPEAEDVANYVQATQGNLRFGNLLRLNVQVPRGTKTVEYQRVSLTESTSQVIFSDGGWESSPKAKANALENIWHGILPLGFSATIFFSEPEPGCFSGNVLFGVRTHPTLQGSTCNKTVLRFRKRVKKNLAT